MDYSYVPKSGKNGIVFELKSFGKHLEHDQHRPDLRQLTPIDQTLSYIIDNKNIKYGLCTNYQRFQLVTRQEGEKQCFVFDFPNKGESLTDEQLKEFVAIFSEVFNFLAIPRWNNLSFSNIVSCIYFVIPDIVNYDELIEHKIDTKCVYGKL